MSAATGVSRHGVWPSGLISGSVQAWGFARSSFYAMKSRQQATAERNTSQSAGDSKTLDLVTVGSWWPSRPTLEASPWEGEGQMHRSGLDLRVCRGIPCFPASGGSG